MRTLLVVVALFLSGSVNAQTNSCGGVGQVACNVAVTGTGGGTVTLGAGSAIAGKFGIDQTTAGVTNGVVVNSGSVAVSSLPGSPAQQTGGTVGLVAGGNVIGGVGAPKAAISTTLTTPPGVTYTGASTTAPLAVCASASADCTPLTVTISATPNNSGWITGLVLQKSTTGATSAQFRVLGFETTPTLTGVHDTSAYSGLAVDELSRAAVGSWLCPTANANLETFECASERPIGYNAFQVTGGTLYFVVTAIAPYVRPTGETITLLSDIAATVP